MLKNIDPLIGPDLLYALAAMGHGDEIVIVDANFPAAAIAATTNYGEVLSIGCHAPRAVEAVLSLMPVDRFEPDPVVTMQVVGDPDAVPEVVRDAMPALEAEGVLMAAVERFAFYARAKSVFAVLHTLEARPYGNFIIRKGVVFPQGDGPSTAGRWWMASRRGGVRCGNSDSLYFEVACHTKAKVLPTRRCHDLDADREGAIRKDRDRHDR